jgi:hypothetical protein
MKRDIHILSLILSFYCGVAIFLFTFISTAVRSPFLEQRWGAIDMFQVLYIADFLMFGLAAVLYSTFDHEK